MAGMTRALAASFLAGVYAQQLTEAGLLGVDNDANLKPVIDEALLTLGTAYDALATAEVSGESGIKNYRKLLRYFGLERILFAVIERVNISLSDPAIRKDREQYVANLQKQLVVLRAEASNAGLTVGPTWQAPTSVGLDFLEPRATWG